MTADPTSQNAPPSPASDQDPDPAAALPPPLPPYDAPPPRPTGPPGQRPFLAPLMGAGEGLGKGLSMAEIMGDPVLRAMGLKLWEETQKERATTRAESGATPGPGAQAQGASLKELLETGTGGEIATSSSREEILRFRDRLAFSADLLETLLEETYVQLEALERYLAQTEPTDPAAPEAAEGATP